jgi:hypothetical protein
LTDAKKIFDWLERRGLYQDLGMRAVHDKINAALADKQAAPPAAQPVAYLFRFHTDDSLAGKPNVRKWQLCEGAPPASLYEEGEVRLLVDAAQVEPAPAPEGFEPVFVKNFLPLISALDRADRKGYLPDAMAEEWAAFDYRLNL